MSSTRASHPNSAPSPPLVLSPDKTTDRPTDATQRTVRISIVTPTLNAARYLEECLASVAAQNGPGVEVEHLVLDGGSTDGTREILAQAKVRQVARSPQDNVVRAMCLGYAAADGDLVGFLGADDVFLPGALQRVAEVYRREQRPLVLCRARWGDANLRSLGELAPPPLWLTAKVHAALGWNYLGAANTFVSPALYRELGGFDETMRKAEDYEFFTRVLARRVSFSRLNHTVCIFRRHGNNESLQHDATYFHDIDRIRALYGSRRAWVNSLLGNGFRMWVYLRNPAWSMHQFYRKLMERRLRG